MDQSEIDALMKAGPKGAKPKKAEKPAPVETEMAPVPAAPAPAQAAAKEEVHRDADGHVQVEIGAVTEVTERETNKVMDQLDQISQLVARQQQLVTDMMRHEGAQSPGAQKAIHEVMSASKEIQDKVFEAMDLMQFQDITRQKLERIVHHLRQIHDYIVDLLGTGLKSDLERPSISHTIAQTGTTPDENKAHADAVIEAFKSQKKG